MEFSPLQPVRFWVDEVRIQASEEYEEPSRAAKVPKVQLTVQLGEGQTDDSLPMYRCRLVVDLVEDAPEYTLPYDVHLGVTGFFTFAREVKVPRPQMSRMVAFNGVAMLYGFARDMIIQHTAVGPYGPFVLPAVNLTDVAESLQESAQSDDSQPLQAPARSTSRRPRKRKTSP